MTGDDDDWTTLSVRRQTAKHFNRIKKEAAQDAEIARDYSADGFINILLSMWTDDDLMAGDSSDADEIARKVAEHLEGSKPLAEMQFDDWFHKDHAQTVAYAIIEELDEVDFEFTDGAGGLSYDDVVAASEQGTRRALEALE
jgi:hypothetical protein